MQPLVGSLFWGVMPLVRMIHVMITIDCWEPDSIIDLTCYMWWSTIRRLTTSIVIFMWPLSLSRSMTSSVLATTSTAALAATIRVGVVALFRVKNCRCGLIWRWGRWTSMKSNSHLHFQKKSMHVGNRDVIAQIGNSHIHDHRAIFFREAIQNASHLIRLIDDLSNCREFINYSFNFQQIIRDG